MGLLSSVSAALISISSVNFPFNWSLKPELIERSLFEPILTPLKRLPDF
ncbi:MAG: hypothetical protein R3A12_00955 [Ignavibacteria bacterium]